MRAWILLLVVVAACGGGSSAEPAPANESEPAPEPPASLPQATQPDVEAEIIGKPGDPVPGLDASYVTTLLGWLAPDGDVIFEAVILWNRDKTLGCGILRRAADGEVNTLLMQGQLLPDTGGGRVKHPKLPLEARGDTLVMAAEVEGGDIEHGLFAVPRTGGTPRLLAEGVFRRARVGEDGDVIAEAATPNGTQVWRIPTDGPAEVLCDRCDDGISSDGTTVVFERDDAAYRIDADGATTRLIGRDDPVAGTLGVVTLVLAAELNDADAVVVHVATSDAACPEAIFRFDENGVEVVARCGEPIGSAPGTAESLRLAAGRSRDVVFAARLSGPGAPASAVYCARPGEPALPVVQSTQRVRVLEEHVVADRDRIAYGVQLYEDGLPVAEGVFRTGTGAPERVVSTDADVPAAGARLRSFPYPLRHGVDVDGDGRLLVPAGLVEARRPSATLGTLLLVR
ncbi:MAG: hypothetical protein AAGD14_07510 [Planctomycetota bacterium]